MNTVKSILLFLVLVSQFFGAGCRRSENEDSVQADQPAMTESSPASSDHDPAVSAREVVGSVKEGPPAQSGECDIIVAPEEDAGSVRCGMSKEEVLQLVGGPEEIADDGRSLLYPSKGFSLYISPTQGVQVINCYSKIAAPPHVTVQDFRGKTKEGIRMGANLSEVLAAYGHPTSQTKSGAQTRLHYQELGITFFLLNDKLVQFMVMPSPNR